MRLLPTAYLASYTLSALGNSVAAIVLPLVVLQTTGSALAAGTVAAATVVPAVAAGLIMGMVIDRINRRTSSVVTDLISAAAMFALPIVDIITGTREALGAVALLIGPAMAGVMVAVWGGTTALWVTAATSLLAALITLLIPHQVGALQARQEARQAQAPKVWRQLKEGWSEVIHNGFVRVTTILTITAVAAIGGLQGIIFPLYFTEIGKPGMVGLVLSAIAAGSLVGAGVYAIAGSRGSRRMWFVMGVVGNIFGLVIVATLISVWVLLAGAFVLGLSVGFFGALIGVLSIERIPESKRGRVLGTQNTFVTAASPLGIFVAGAMTELTGVHTALVLLACVWTLGLLFALFARPMRNLDARPSEPLNNCGVTQSA